MEQKLREALDRASFECAVVRIENGVYNFGPNVCAVVDITPENEVVACHQDNGDWAPIDEFIRSIAQRPPPVIQYPGSGSAAPQTASASASASASSWPPSSGGSKASPVDNAVSSAGTGSEAPSERRLFGPPAKAAQPPHSTDSSQRLGTPVPISSHGAVASTSPRRVAPIVTQQQSGTASSGSHPPAVTLGGRQAAGSTPERVRMPGQPATASGFPSQAQVLAPGTGQPQSGAPRMLIAPNSGSGLRYGVTTLAPGRQMPSTAAPVYQQGASSPRLQG